MMAEFEGKVKAQKAPTREGGVKRGLVSALLREAADSEEGRSIDGNAAGTG
jgi:hypothetical protein